MLILSRSFRQVLGVLVVACAASKVMAAAGVSGEQIYQKHCSACHGGGHPKAPALSTLEAMNGRYIMDALTKGRMQGVGSTLSSVEKEALVAWLSRKTAAGAEWEASLACRNSAVDLSQPWYQSRWGFDGNNSRFQRHTRLSHKNIHRLKRQWLLAFPAATELRSQPVVIGDTLFLAVADIYKLYALDRHSGCVKWVYALDNPPRSGLSAGKLADGRTVLVLGDMGGHVHVVDVRNGENVWTIRGVQSQNGIITGSPVLDEGVLYVPHSTLESMLAIDPHYECCQSQGMITAHRLDSGALIWTAKTMPEARLVGQNAAGAKRYGPAGASIWATPLIDKKRQQIIAGTGPISSGPDVGSGDAIIAFDLKTGEKRWSFQATRNDLWNSSCRAKYDGKTHPNCPVMGWDFDFGAAPILATTAEGKEILLAGQKSGQVYGLDPASGELLWETRLSDGSNLGGIHWGMAQAGNYLYVPVNDPDLKKVSGQISEQYNNRMAAYRPRPGLYKLDIRDGRVIWAQGIRELCKAVEKGRCGKQIGLSAAPIAIEGAVIAPSVDGRVRAFSMEDGSLLIDKATAMEYKDTVNGITGHGGTIDNASMAIADNQLFIQSGYGLFGEAGNVLIVYELEDGSG